MQDLSNIIARVWDRDHDLQISCLQMLSRTVRHVSDEEIINRDVETLKKMGAFFIPDDEYLVGAAGNQVMQFKYGIYRNGYCTLAERLAIPLRTPNGHVIGLVGYSNTGVEEQVVETETTDLNVAETSEMRRAGLVIKYLYPPAHVFEKGRFLFTEPEWFRRAVMEEYICITDGLFDTIRLNQEGINAASLCGSMLTKWHKLYLSLIPLVIIVGDNDNAGVKLINTCMRQLPKCVPLRYYGAGDIDDFLKTQSGIEEIREVIKQLQETGLSFQTLGRPKVNYKQFEHFDSIAIPETDQEMERADSRTVQERGSQVLQRLKNTNRIVYKDAEDTDDTESKLTNCFTSHLKEKYGKTEKE